MKFEYQFTQASDVNDLMVQVGKYGEDNWELVSMSHNSLMWFAIFKRPAVAKPIAAPKGPETALGSPTPGAGPGFRYWRPQGHMGAGTAYLPPLRATQSRERDWMVIDKRGMALAWCFDTQKEAEAQIEVIRRETV